MLHLIPRRVPRRRLTSTQASIRVRAATTDPARNWSESNKGVDFTHVRSSASKAYSSIGFPQFLSVSQTRGADETGWDESPQDQHTSRDARTAESRQDEPFVDRVETDWLQNEAQANHVTTEYPLSQRATAESLKNITRILETIQDDSLLTELWPLLRNQMVIQSLSATTFIEILRRLDPQDDFLPFRHGYCMRIPKHYRQLRCSLNNHLDSLQDRRNRLAEICKYRVKSGRPLGLGEYRQILRCARATYDGSTASVAMNAMLSRKLEPDFTCCQAFMEAKCWADTWHPVERQLLRVIPPNLKRRLDDTEAAVGIKSRLSPHKVGAGGLKNEIVTLFNYMGERGTLADQNIFGYLITALAREGDIDGVKATLKSAWDVDVGTSNSAEYQRTSMRSDSPLYPTNDTLFVVAHAFGTNNDIATGFRAVELMSRKFDIPITSVVWTELLEWTYVLSVPRSEKHTAEGFATGKLPIRSPEDLWHLLTGIPYYFAPTLSMYDVLIRHYEKRKMLKHLLHYILECMESRLARKTEDDHNLRHGAGRQSVLDRLNAGPSMTEDFTFFVYVTQWFKLLLSRRRWSPSSSRTEVLCWQRQLLPDLVDTFWRYRDLAGVRYTIETGFVSLHEEDEPPSQDSSKWE